MNIFDKLDNIEEFEHNIYFERYKELIIRNKNIISVKHETQKHHIMPICYYKEHNGCSNREEAINYSIADSNELVILSHVDHLLAHIYLCLCCKKSSNLHYRLAYAVRNTTRKLSRNVTPEQLLTDYDLQREYEEIKKSQSYGYSKRMIGNKLGLWRKKSEDELLGISRRNSGGRYLNSGLITKHVKEQEIPTYLAIGWKFGSIQNHKNTCKNTIIINNGEREKRTSIDNLSKYLQEGGIRGKIKGYKKD